MLSLFNIHLIKGKIAIGKQKSSLNNKNKQLFLIGRILILNF